MDLFLDGFQPVIQPVISLNLTMNQYGLPTLGLVPEPRFATSTEMALCKSYRDAVRLSWQLRAIKNMSQRTVAEIVGCYAPHVTDYLHIDDDKKRRDLPLDKVNDWCRAVGNWVVIQYLMQEANLNVMEEMIQRKNVA